MQAPAEEHGTRRGSPAPHVAARGEAGIPAPKRPAFIARHRRAIGIAAVAATAVLFLVHAVHWHWPYRISGVVGELPALGRATIRRLTEGIDERLECIVRFLAILELCKQGLVDLDQVETFGDIVVVWLGPDHVDTESLAEIDVYEG